MARMGIKAIPPPVEAERMRGPLSAEQEAEEAEAAKKFEMEEIKREAARRELDLENARLDMRRFTIMRHSSYGH